MKNKCHVVNNEFLKCQNLKEAVNPFRAIFYIIISCIQIILNPNIKTPDIIILFH